MKTCPFCKEEIHDEAIKCRYCSSSLLPSQVDAPAAGSAPAVGTNQVVYILDQDLIRFGKFAVAVLAVFVTIGIFLYGFNIKDSATEVDKSLTEVRQSAENIGKVRSDVEKVQEDVKSDQTTVAKMIEELDALEKQGKADTGDAVAAAANARAAADKINADEKSMEDVKKQSADLLKQATETVTEVQEKKNEFYAQIKLYVPGVTEPKNQDEADAISATGADASNASSNSPPPTDRSFTPAELAKIYHFPAAQDGRGQSIGLIELGGGYRPAELAAYFRKLGVTPPSVGSVSVDGGSNSPSNANSADGEVQLDIEVVGAAAPGARIVVYFTPNTNNGFTDAINTAVHDTTNRISILCIAWGGPESSWSPAAMQTMNHAFMAAAAQKITVVAASGDSGPTDGVTDGKNHVDFPASSPWVTAVGGTHLHVLNNGAVSEMPWSDKTGGASGGGVSVVFPLPDWQAKAGVPTAQGGEIGRGVPDVAADASPSTGYEVSIDGISEVIGGTAAAAPLWAGLIARINQGLGHNVGFINPILYEKIGPSGVLHPLTVQSRSGGSNAATERPVWNVTAGWGTPDGQKLLEALR